MFAFDAYYPGWQYRQGIVAPKEADADKEITDIIVALAYDNNYNTAIFDNVSLRIEPAQTYYYDENGNLKTAAQMGTGMEEAEYADNGIDLIKYTAANGVVFNYSEYNQAHDVIAADSDGVAATYTYDDAGNMTETTLTGGELTMQSSATMTSDYNHTASVTDAAGNTTEYIYDDQRELLLTTTNAKGTVMTNTYDEKNDRLTQIEQIGGPSVDYAYAGGRLSSLTRNTARNGNSLSQVYHFAYNLWGQNTSISVGSTPLVSYAYEENGGNLTTTTYGNGDSVSYYYDSFDRLIKTVYNDTGNYVEYAYNAEGAVAELRYKNSSDSLINSYSFEYDSTGRLIRSSEYDEDHILQRTEHCYDSIGRLSKQTWFIGTSSFTESYVYDDPTETESADGSLKQLTTAEGSKINYTYDALKRLEGTTVTDLTNNELYSTEYDYKANGENTTSLVQTRNVTDANGDLLSGYQYTYDALGNIIGIYESEPVGDNEDCRLLASYTYDEQNQLIAETIYHYAAGSTSTSPQVTVQYTFTYDTAGNILTETVSEMNSAGLTETEMSYSYENSDWKDLLTSYEGGKIAYEGQTYTEGTTTTIGQVVSTVTGTAISGNPVSYYNGQRYTMQWEQGRNLAQSYFETENHTSTVVPQWVDRENTSNYTYNADGIRTGKTTVVKTYRYRLPSSGGSEIAGVGGSLIGKNYERYLSASTTTTHRYLTQNGKIVRETIGTGSTAKILDFIYDESGRPFALNYSTDGGSTFTTYYYVLNLQGDVVKLIDSSSTVMASYTYNAWGELLSSNGTMAEINPLRYRGYYYDTETGWYYLQSRYYDPILHRFINADSYASTGQGILGTNMFAYCNNRPVRYMDPSGARFIPADERYYGNGLYAYTDSGSGRYEFCQEPIYLVQQGDSEITNCFALCLGADHWVNQGSISGQAPGKNLEDAVCVTKEDVLALGWGIREVDDNNSSLMEGEYMIALRVGIDDYHYMIKREGIWWQKNGGLPMQQLGEINPATFSWDKPCYSLINFDGNRTQAYIFGYYKNYYDSKTIFFAIKPN